MTMTKQLDQDTRDNLIKAAMSRGYSQTEAEIYADRFDYIRNKFGYARAYQMFIERLIS